MDIYVCDANWLKTDMVDVFKSVIWTDRYNSYGDVVLSVADTPANRALITEGIFLANSDSPSIMLVETIDIKDGNIEARGTDVVYFLRNRIFRTTWQQITNNTWSWRGTGYGLITLMMSYVLNTGSYMTNGNVLTSAQGSNEPMPKITVSAVVPSGTNATLVLAVPWGTLYDAIKFVADTDGLGFSLTPQSMTDGTGNLLFKSYRGLDRTSSQSSNGVVIFDPALDNFVGLEELRDISGFKNVAWVWPSGITAQTQIVQVALPGAAALTAWQRRTLMVLADDVSVTDYNAADLATILQQRGLDALANNNYSKILDGQVVPQSMYKYGVDYALGDVVELRGALGGASQKARIMEYIRSQDSTGEKAYPTLQVVA